MSDVSVFVMDSFSFFVYGAVRRLLHALVELCHYPIHLLDPVPIRPMDVLDPVPARVPADPRMLALAMSQHGRLGKGSQLARLGPDQLQAVCGFAFDPEDSPNAAIRSLARSVRGASSFLRGSFRLSVFAPGSHAFHCNSLLVIADNVVTERGVFSVLIQDNDETLTITSRLLNPPSQLIDRICKSEDFPPDDDSLSVDSSYNAQTTEGYTKFEYDGDDRLQDVTEFVIETMQAINSLVADGLVDGTVRQDM